MGKMLRFFYVARCTLECDPNKSLESKFTPRFKTGTTEIQSILPVTKDLTSYSQLAARMRKTHLDYREVMEEYRGDPDAFLYLDPPYVSKTVKQYTQIFTVDDLMWLYNFLDDPNTKCNVMLNVDYTGWTRETFAKRFRLCYPVTYGVTSCVDIYQKFHIMVCNY